MPTSETGSVRKHYCRCHPRSAAVRIPTDWYCFVHRRFVCDNCIYDESDNRHVNCQVGLYSDFLKQAHFEWPPTCTLCSSMVNDDPFKAVRMMCKCVFHSNCLRQHMVEQYPSNAGITCPKCHTNVNEGTNEPSNLARSVKKFLKLVSRDRIFSKSARRRDPAASSSSSTDHPSSSSIGINIASSSDSRSSSKPSSVDSSPPPRQSSAQQRGSPSSASGNTTIGIGIDIGDPRNRDASERQSLLSSASNDGSSMQRRRHVGHRHGSDSERESTVRSGGSAAVAYASAQKAQSVRVGTGSAVGDGRAALSRNFGLFIALFLFTNLLMAYLLFFSQPAGSGAVGSGLVKSSASVAGVSANADSADAVNSETNRKLGIRFLDEN